MGPLAGKVLRRVLRICRSEPEEKREAIESLLSQDPAECPDGIVCGFDVYDPRLS